ncbi:unnamed protein product, partial [Porites lobata]
LDVEVFSNFRPISNLMFMSKLTEKVVASQLINHISRLLLGPILYLLYTSPLGDIVRQYNMGYHFYADDTQLYLSFSSLSGDDQAYSVSQVESCVRDIDRWMSCN